MTARRASGNTDHHRRLSRAVGWEEAGAITPAVREERERNVGVQLTVSLSPSDQQRAILREKVIHSPFTGVQFSSTLRSGLLMWVHYQDSLVVVPSSRRENGGFQNLSVIQ